VFVAMVGGDGGGKRTLSYGIHRGTKEEHRNNYKEGKNWKIPLYRGP
jgi:hypothetical protein